MQTTKCDLGSWLKARILLKESNASALKLDPSKILKACGGIKKVVNTLLSNRKLLTTNESLKLIDVLQKNINKHASKKNKKIKPKKDTKEYYVVANNKKKTKIKLTSIGSECIKYISSFLPFNEIAKSFKNVCILFGIIGLEEIKKADCYYINAQNLIHKNTNKYYINIIDIGQKSFFNQYRTYKYDQFKNIFTELSKRVDIPLKYLSIWYYSRRKNETYRPNREIKLDFNANETEISKISGNTPTFPHIKKIKSIFTRIGDVFRSKRCFMLFDSRSLNYISPNIKKSNDSILILLKYFDLFTQKLYFADWIMVQKNLNTIKDIAIYIEAKLIGSNKSCFNLCKKYFNEMNKYDRDKLENKLILYEEVRVAKITEYSYDESIDEVNYNGDILIFQLNPDHSYFKINPVSFSVQTFINNSKTCIYNKACDFVQKK